MKNEKNVFDYVLNQLRGWAEREKIDIDEHGYIAGPLGKELIVKNLFGGLDKRTEKDFDAGKGSELKDKKGNKPKMAALHSSSALACNFFQYWRKIEYYDLLTEALGFGEGYDDLKFESVHKIKGKRGTPPHIDVEIIGDKTQIRIPIAIESKFLEPYEQIHNNKIPFKKAYFKVKSMWDGYEKCRKLALEINDNREWFQYFYAPQILKHMLGLYYNYGKDKFVLIYLWYKIESQEAKQHEQEIGLFKDRINSEFDFRTLTYQELFKKIKKLCNNSHAKYIKYLEDRYFKNLR